MTQIERSILNPPRPDTADAANVIDILSSAMKALRRHSWLMAVTVATCLALAVVSVVTMTPIYTASATIYIDPRESRGFQEAGGILLNSDALVVDSEVEILMSSMLAERVVDRLGLGSPAEQDSDAPTLTAKLRAFFSSDADDVQSGLLSSEEAAKRRAVAMIRRNVEVGRLGNTYVIEITVRNSDKQLAARVANAYTEEYLESSLEVQAERLTQLNNWSSDALREAIGSLRRAEAEVNEFRLIHQIDSVGLQVAGSELADMNAALVTLRNQRFQNELLLERIGDFLNAGDAGVEAPDVGREEIAQIKSQILQTEMEYARVIATGKKNSPDATILPRELEAMRMQLVDQYERIAAQLESQIRFSTEEEERLADRAEALRRDVADVSGKEAELRELQMRADGERAVYQALLKRFNETSDVLAYKSNSARVLTAANVPPGPSSPQTAKILAMGLVAGLFIGALLIFVREQLDKGIRQPREIEALGIPYLGAVPAIRGALFRLRRQRNLNTPVLTGTRRRRETALMSFAVDFPLSEFSETVRSIVFDTATSNSDADRAQIIAVTSTTTGDGKSTLAANLAAYFAKQGKRAHLVDFDLRNPTLSRVFAARLASRTLPDGEDDEADEAMHTSKKIPSDFDFSGQAERTNASDMIEFVSPKTISNYLKSAKANSDVVILDIGSLSESPDARMCAELADYVVLAVRWGLTSADQLERSLSRGLSRSGKPVAAVLTMVPPSAQLEKPAAGDAAARRMAMA